MTTKKLTIALAAASAVAALAVGGAVAFAAIPGSAPAHSGSPAILRAAPEGSDPGDVQIAKDCLAATPNGPDLGSWYPGAKIDTGAGNGFLMIRNDRTAAVCVIEKGKGAGVMGADFDTRHVYGKLTAQRPFDYLTSMNYQTASIHFGIASDNVAGVSLVGPDKSVTGGVLKNGTFIVKTTVAEDSGQGTTNHVRAILNNGQVIDGPFRV
jgi:hypothetical protein